MNIRWRNAIKALHIMSNYAYPPFLIDCDITPLAINIYRGYTGGFFSEGRF